MSASAYCPAVPEWRYQADALIDWLGSGRVVANTEVGTCPYSRQVGHVTVRSPKRHREAHEVPRGSSTIRRFVCWADLYGHSGGNPRNLIVLPVTPEWQSDRVSQSTV